MSKASEYVSRIEAAKASPNDFQVIRNEKFESWAVVTNRGELFNCSSQPITAKEALELVDWIRTTFGESQGAKGEGK